MNSDSSNKMMQYVTRLAKQDQKERFRVLTAILNEEGLQFTVQTGYSAHNKINNVIISLNPSGSRLVIGAHYDSVEGSTGANDNAVGIAILVMMAQHIFRNVDKSIDIVFFDKEELGYLGSQFYIKNVGKENITSMINLDICGYGDVISISGSGVSDKSKFYSLLDAEKVKNHGIVYTGFLPKGDESQFAENNIPNVSIAMLPSHDAEIFSRIGTWLVDHKDLSPQLLNDINTLDVVATMHNKCNDNINYVTEKAMGRMLSFLLDGFK